MICIEMAFLPTDFLFQTHLEDHPPYTSHTGLPSCTPQDFHGHLSYLFLSLKLYPISLSHTYIVVDGFCMVVMLQVLSQS